MTLGAKNAFWGHTNQMKRRRIRAKHMTLGARNAFQGHTYQGKQRRIKAKDMTLEAVMNLRKSHRRRKQAFSNGYLRAGRKKRLSH